MELISKDNYRKNFEYYKAVLSNKNVVLRHASALECLEMFMGYLSDPKIDVYSTTPINDSSVNE